MFVGITTALKWLFFRLPWPFSITFALISLAWALFGFHYAYHHVAVPLGSIFNSSFKLLLHGAMPSWLADFVGGIDGLIFAIVTLVCFIVGFIVAYDIAALVNLLASAVPPKPLKYPPGFAPVPSENNPVRPPFDGSTRIGIVLAGGGAKGAYQAGAIRAIYEFLESRGALGNVRVISGTSIGSWNAMFWLANLVKSAKEGAEPGCLEWWWKRLTARHLVAPRFFLPSLNNAFLSTDPWRREFDQIFGSDAVKKTLHDTGIHFYLTRSNVRSAGLECATNNPEPPIVNRVKYDFVNSSASIDEFFSRLKTGVFASMDLPPLFPYARCDDQLYEDGGVIENLPLSFPAAEDCDLIFVLPLNSDFEQEPNNRSLVARISRVLDVQQGALERNGFKLLYLFNENAALRKRVEQLTPPEAGQKPTDQPRDQDAQHSLNYAMHRTHQEIRIFAVCPDKSFVKATINTRDLWNTRGARTAFDVMYGATAGMLAAFDFTGPQKGPHVAMVRRSGTHFLDHEF